ncbi:MAG: DEAD/DEAH box helicase family protein [Pseudomonadota bacterium]
MTNITFIDKPCGAGKTTEQIASLDPRGQYLIVAPFLSEVDRWKAEAKIPLEAAPDDSNKSDWLRQNVLEGNSIVCTHKLFDLVDLDRTDLSEYDLIIDEVFDCVESIHGVKEEVFERVYIGEGYASVDPATGRVTPTAKWIAHSLEAEKLAATVRNDLYQKAKQGSLYKVDGKGFFVSIVPVELFTSPRSCTVLTYQADSSQMVGYLRRLGIPFRIDRTDDAAFKYGLRQRLVVRDVPALRDTQMTHTAQDKMRKGAEKVSSALLNLRKRELVGVEAKDIMLSCNKSKWIDQNDQPKGLFARESGLSKVNFLPKTTRGTNKYRHCSHALYLNDLRLNPAEKEWLGWSKGQEDQWALSELIQWVMRSRLREGEDVSLYLASGRMKALLEDYLNNKKEDEADYLLAA